LTTKAAVVMRRRTGVVDLVTAVVERAWRELDAFCEAQVPHHVRDQLRLEASIRGRTLTLWEVRAPWPGSRTGEWTRMKIAQFRFDSATRLWTLYCHDRHSRAHKYELLQPRRDFVALLQEVRADPTGIFWG
jgi:hypothetical protein